MDRFVLKWIALISMILDHMGAMFFPNIILFRIVGRLAFPIFAYLIAEGFYYTSDVKHYMKRLFIFALISEVPFDLAFRGMWIDIRYQNVFFTLFIGVLLLYTFNRQYSAVEKAFCLLIGVLAADLFGVDYGGWGVLMIFFFYYFREKPLWKNLSVALINIIAFGGLQIYGTLALIPIALHNGQRGRPMKYFFYVAYPLHLILFVCIRILL